MASSTEHSIVLITGANQGIGFEVAKLLCETKPEYRILIGVRDAERGKKAVDDLKSLGYSYVDNVIIDVTDDESISRAAKVVEAKYGVLDVLVNNAGINNEIPSANPQKDNVKLPLREQYRQAYEVNVFGHALTTEAFIPLLEKSRHPRVVFVSSHTGSLTLRSDPTNPWYERLHRGTAPIYRSSKAAVNMLTCHYADKFESWKVNASCPNLTATNFSRGVGRPPSESAKNIVRLAVLGTDGKSGTYSDEHGIVPW